ncbi:MAG: hypothetical protein Harvfovirus67_3 [Harvfovirus sp.]|uniref:Ankyrin repeat protein n=1 Tax=Harvfovirus sp. TaxID=2487768 RepID=A0A3G5A7M6_9VIRU|nr:MAG: hypothetical protein Harvfovirus67_3 [Harvfovirus sp.]
MSFLKSLLHQCRFFLQKSYATTIEKKRKKFMTLCTKRRLKLIKKLYPFDPDIYPTTLLHKCFTISCRQNSLNVAQLLYISGNIDIHGKDAQYAFIDSCSRGHLTVAKWLHSIGVTLMDPLLYYKAILKSCRYKRIEVFKWLYSFGSVQVTNYFETFLTSLGTKHSHLETIQHIYSQHDYTNANVELGVFRLACNNGDINLAKWLYSRGKFDLDILNSVIFSQSCLHSQLPIVKWLHSISNKIINPFQLQEIFVHTCTFNDLEIAKWLYSTFYENTDIHFDNEYIFYETLRYVCAPIECYKWIYSLGNVNIHFRNDNVFHRWAFRGQNTNVRWLLTLDRFNDFIVNAYASTYDLETLRMIYKLGYKPLYPLLKGKFQMEVKRRVRYVKKVISIIGRLMRHSNMIMERRYKYGGIGYIEALEHFQKKLIE